MAKTAPTAATARTLEPLGMDVRARARSAAFRCLIAAIASIVLVGPFCLPAVFWSATYLRACSAAASAADLERLAKSAKTALAVTYFAGAVIAIATGGMIAAILELVGR